MKKLLNRVCRNENEKINSILFALFLIITGCSSDPNQIYPVSYTLDHIDQTDEALYLVGANNLLTALPLNTGSYGTGKEELKKDIRDLFEIAFNLKEVILLNEDSLRIHFFIDEEEFDTIVSYTSIENEIMIDSIDGGLLSYDKDEDQFVICGVATFALPGPNVPQPGIEYNQFNVIECTEDFENIDYAHQLLDGFSYSPMDTVGVLLTKLIYK